MIKTISGHLTAKDLAELNYKRCKDFKLITDKTISKYEVFLEKVNAQPEHTQWQQLG